MDISNMLSLSLSPVGGSRSDEGHCCFGGGEVGFYSPLPVIPLRSDGSLGLMDPPFRPPSEPHTLKPQFHIPTSNRNPAYDMGLHNAMSPSYDRKRKSPKSENREPVPRKLIDTLGQKSSRYHGVTKHKWTGRYKAYLWDNSCTKEGLTRKGRLGN